MTFKLTNLSKQILVRELSILIYGQTTEWAAEILVSHGFCHAAAHSITYLHRGIRTGKVFGDLDNIRKSISKELK